MMSTTLKPWSWVVSAAGFAVCFGVLLWLRSYDAVFCSGAVLVLMLVLAIQSFKSFSAYWRQVDVDQFRARREALALSAEVQLADKFSHMHPETARLVLNYNKTVWLIDECDVDDVCAWYLKADQRINSRFFVWVLENSNDYSIMPAHGNLSDKAFNWDRVVSDRLMFQAMCAVLVNRNMLTEAHGNQPGLWIEPWNPRRAAKRFGVEHLLEEEVEAEAVGV